MYLKILLFAILCILHVDVDAVVKNYEGYKVYKVDIENDADIELLKQLQKSGIGEFWEDDFVINTAVKVAVSRNHQEMFYSKLISSGVGVHEIFADLQRLIEEQMKPAKPTRNIESFYSMTWDRYYSLEEINNWLDELVVAYPNIITSVDIGQTFENRTIKGIKINYNQSRNVTYIGVIEGAIHAREWISPATVTWIIKEFLTSSDPEIRAMAQDLEWHIFPVTNPDGYAYTFTDNRLWRKNRNPNYSTTCAAEIDDDMSNGVDLNRNFDYVWMYAGASDDPCTNTYAGPSGFSEAESQAISEYVTSLQQQGELIYYLSFHSYSQLVIVPYSHIESGQGPTYVENYSDMYEIGVRGAEALEQRFGTQYQVGLSADVLYPMSGSSFDWVKNATNAPVTYLIELRDVGEYGFLLPAEQIIPSNLEIMDFMLEMDKTTRFLNYYSAAGSVISSFVAILFNTLMLFLLK